MDVLGIDVLGIDVLVNGALGMPLLEGVVALAGELA